MADGATMARSSAVRAWVLAVLLLVVIAGGYVVVTSSDSTARRASAACTSSGTSRPCTFGMYTCTSRIRTPQATPSTTGGGI